MVGTMLNMLRPQEGECTLDLYAGAGLFTAALADAVGATGTVISIEGSPVTHKDARSNFAPDGCSRTENSADTRIEVIRGDVARHLLDLKTALEFGEIPLLMRWSLIHPVRVRTEPPWNAWMRWTPNVFCTWHVTRHPWGVTPVFA